MIADMATVGSVSRIVRRAAATRDSGGVVARVRAAYEGRAGNVVDELDGLTVTHAGAGADDPMWWFNLRGSNTEPLLRLNAEAADGGTMSSVRDAVLTLVRDGQEGTS